LTLSTRGVLITLNYDPAGEGTFFFLESHSPDNRALREQGTQYEDPLTGVLPMLDKMRLSRMLSRSHST